MTNLKFKFGAVHIQASPFDSADEERIARAELEIQNLLEVWVSGWDRLQPHAVSPVPHTQGAVMVRPSGEPMPLEEFYGFLKAGHFEGPRLAAFFLGRQTQP